MVIQTAGLVILNNRKLLLAFSKNKQAFYLPGGKVDAGETSVEALVRETGEELGIALEPNRLRYYTHITAAAYGESNGAIMEQDCFRYELDDHPRPGAEIGALQYFDEADFSLEPAQVPGVVMLIEQLQKEGLMD
jgi:8-oxo-dGTP pyrophosphatase MutT (NUDIX family)